MMNSLRLSSRYWLMAFTMVTAGAIGSQASAADDDDIWEMAGPAILAAQVKAQALAQAQNPAPAPTPSPPPPEHRVDLIPAPACTRASQAAINFLDNGLKIVGNTLIKLAYSNGGDITVQNCVTNLKAVDKIALQSNYACSQTQDAVNRTQSCVAYTVNKYKDFMHFNVTTPVPTSLTQASTASLLLGINGPVFVGNDGTVFEPDPGSLENQYIFASGGITGTYPAIWYDQQIGVVTLQDSHIVGITSWGPGEWIISTSSSWGFVDFDGVQFIQFNPNY